MFASSSDVAAYNLNKNSKTNKLFKRTQILISSYKNRDVFQLVVQRPVHYSGGVEGG